MYSLRLLNINNPSPGCVLDVLMLFFFPPDAKKNEETQWRHCVRLWGACWTRPLFNPSVRACVQGPSPRWHVRRSNYSQPFSITCKYFPRFWEARPPRGRNGAPRLQVLRPGRRQIGLF